MKPNSLSLVLPCYNPVPGWETTLFEHYLRIKERLKDTISCLEVIVVNDGSKTGIDRHGLHYLARHIAHFTFLEYPVNKGKGYAVRRGVQTARGTYIIYTDIDFPFETGNFFEIMSLLEKGADVVAGRRSRDYFQRLSPRRAAASRLIQLLNRHILGTGDSDAQAGIKGMNRHGRQLMLQTSVNRFLFDTEFIALATKNADIRVEVVELHLRKKGQLFQNEHRNFFKGILEFCHDPLETLLV